MPTPIWLLDFDGVINALSKRGDRNVWDDWRSADIEVPDNGTYPLLWANEVVELVQEAVTNGVSVVWLTTWREHTKLLPKVIDGLPDGLPWWDEITIESFGYKLDPMRVLGQKWKAQVAQAMLSPDTPVLWTDDNLSHLLNGTDRGWFNRRPGGTTYVSPNPNIGLSQRNAREIREWMEETCG